MRSSMKLIISNLVWFRDLDPRRPESDRCRRVTGRDIDNTLVDVRLTIQGSESRVTCRCHILVSVQDFPCRPRDLL